MTMSKAALSVLLLSSAAPVSFAADVFPSKPVRVIAGFGPGSTVDFAARIVSQQLSEHLGKPFIVDNRPGAAGTIGSATVAKAAPDGYTLLLGELGLTTTPHLVRQLPYDVLRDFTPITQLIRTPMALVVVPSIKAATVKELVAYAQANPGKLNYASVGIGSAVHVATELFRLAAKIDIVQVNYKTGGEMVSGLLGGQTQMLLTTMPNVTGIVKSGKVRALAVTNDGKRSPAMPEVPTMGEAGVPEATVYTWSGFLGPRGLPRPLVTHIHAEVTKALATPAVRERFLADGAEIVGSTPEQFSIHIRNELERWGRVIKAANISRE